MALHRIIQAPQVEHATAIVAALAEARDPLAVAGVLLQARACSSESVDWPCAVKTCPAIARGPCMLP